MTLGNKTENRKQKKVMAKKTSPNTNKLPVFTVEKSEKKNSAVAKISIPKGKLSDVGEVISDLLSKAEAGGIAATHVRGTLTLY